MLQAHRSSGGWKIVQQDMRTQRGAPFFRVPHREYEIPQMRGGDNGLVVILKRCSRQERSQLQTTNHKHKHCDGRVGAGALQ